MTDIFVIIFNIILFGIVSFLFLIKPVIPAKILYKKSKNIELKKVEKILRGMGLLFFLMFIIAVFNAIK